MSEQFEHLAFLEYVQDSFKPANCCGMPTKLAPANSHNNPTFVAAMEEDTEQQVPIANVHHRDLKPAITEHKWAQFERA